MPDLVRFGPFELDLETAELQAAGRIVRLPEQQFQILQMLLLREGGVVSREEIRKKLWPNDTVVRPAPILDECEIALDHRHRINIEKSVVITNPTHLDVKTGSVEIGDFSLKWIPVAKLVPNSIPGT
jgi:hypothetical protein